MTMIPTGSIIGIIGGGQLGRMMANAASELGYRVHIYMPEHDSPASHVAYKTTLADYHDTASLASFAESVDVITFEFENIPVESLILLETIRPVFPSANILKTSRNRITEKTFINSLGIGTAPFAPVTSLETLQDAAVKIGLPAILKTTELGYDGKGQITLKSLDELASAFESLKTSEAILEGFVDFTMEISVIVARSEAENAVCYVPVQNIHKHHILDKTIAPAPISENLSKQATDIALTIAESLDLRGLLAVEMFVTSDNAILVNELAPRPHNSGHWSMDAAVTSQFEQAIRAVCGLPLGSPALLHPCEMKNLVGDEVLKWQEYLADTTAKLHLYGKKEVRAGRKMGHVNYFREC